MMRESAYHERGRRCPQVGDVLEDQETGQVAVVQAVRRSSHDGGTALLEWDSGRKRYTERSLSSLRRLRLLRVGEEINSASARHRLGWRQVQVGDVLADPGDLEREAVVMDVDSARARVSWLETGRTSHRTHGSLKQLVLVRVA